MRSLMLIKKRIHLLICDKQGAVGHAALDARAEAKRRA